MKLALPVVVGLGGCKWCHKEETCPSTRMTNANFIIEEYDNSIDPTSPYYGIKGWQFYDTDTVCLDRIRLTPMDMNAEHYQWIIGADTFTNKQPMVYGFTPQHPNQNLSYIIPIKLTTWKTPDRSCFPNDPGKATITRIMTARHWSQSKVFGKWRMVFSDQAGDTSSFELKYSYNPDTKIGDALYTGALMKGDCFARTQNNVFGIRQAYFARGTCNANWPIEGEYVNIVVDPNSPNQGSGQIKVEKTYNDTYIKSFKAYRILP